jgi:hypothetical protein
MVWSAILERDGKTSCVSFTSMPDAEDAFRNISKVMRADGFSVVAIIKGDSTHAFYGVELEARQLVSGD